MQEIGVVIRQSLLSDCELDVKGSWSPVRPDGVLHFNSIHIN